MRREFIAGLGGVVRWRARDLIMLPHWALSVGRYDLSRSQGHGLLSCERQVKSLPAGRRSHGYVQKNFAVRAAEVARNSRQAHR